MGERSGDPAQYPSLDAISNFDIMDILKNIKSYRGCFMRDDLPEKIGDLESGTVNLDDSDGEGTHWVCYYNDPKSEYVEYFDSFGLAPPTEVKKFLDTSGKKIRMSTGQIQDITSRACGFYCCYYIIEREHGVDQYDVIYSLDQMPTDLNEQAMQQYFIDVFDGLREKEEHSMKGGKLLEVIVDGVMEPTKRDALDICCKVLENKNASWKQKGYAKMLKKIIRAKNSTNK